MAEGASLPVGAAGRAARQRGARDNVNPNANPAEPLADRLRDAIGRRQDLYVKVAGLRIRYWDVGEGSPVLLLHGLGVSAEAWLLNVDALARRHRVLVPDLPGSGLSAKGGFAYSVEGLVKFVLDFLAATQADHVCLVGGSLGGLVALRTALDHPDHVERLVLVDSAGLGREIGIWFRFASLPIIGRLASNPSERSAEEMLLGILSNASELPHDFAEAWTKVALGPEAMATVRAAIRAGVDALGQRKAVVLRKRLAEVRAPTLIVWGSDDPIFPVTHAVEAHRLIPGSVLRIFANCLHCPPFERHNEFNELLLRFIEAPQELI